MFILLVLVINNYNTYVTDNTHIKDKQKGT